MRTMETERAAAAEMSFEEYAVARWPALLRTARVNTSAERPASIDDLPIGAPPAVPYVVDDTLHFQGEEYDVPAGWDRERNGMFQSAGDTALLIDEDEESSGFGDRTYSVYPPREGDPRRPPRRCVGDVPQQHRGAPVSPWRLSGPAYSPVDAAAPAAQSVPPAP